MTIDASRIGGCKNSSDVATLTTDGAMSAVQFEACTEVIKPLLGIGMMCAERPDQQNR